MNASSSDQLDPNAPVRAEFTVSAHEREDLVQASITFQSDGLQLLAAGGRVIVNNVELAPERLRKQGFWYRAQVRRAPIYVLQYALAGGQPVRTQEVPDRVFVPEIPLALSRGRGATIVFRGPPLAANERLFVELTGGEAVGKWGFVLRCMFEGNRIVVPAAQLAEARLGKAQLYVGVTLRESAAGNLSITRAVGSERPVDITD